MSFDRYCQLIADLCQSVGIPDADEVLTRGELRLGALTVQIPFFDNDPEAIYLTYNFGALRAGRSYRKFRFIVRCPMNPELNGEWLADTLVRYADHGIYWRNNTMSSSDEIIESLLDRNYSWVKV